MRHTLYGIISLLSFMFFTGCDLSKKNQTQKTTSDMTQMTHAKKIFSFARKDDPRSLDPQAQLDELSATFVAATYDTLFEYHYLKRPYQLTPLLLKDMPTSSPDGLTYHFALKENVRFTDDACFAQGSGRNLNADDVLFTIKRFADANINSQSWFFLANTIVGLDELHEKTKRGNVDTSKEDVSGLKKTGEYSFSLTLKQKNPLILYAFASSSTAIVAHEAVTKYGKEFAQHPVGSGPFKLKEYLKKQTMILEKNTNYHQVYPTDGESSDRKNGLLEASGKTLPFIDEVHLEYIPESQPEILKFKKGDLAWVGLDKDNFGQMIQTNPKGGFTLKPELQNIFNLYTEPSLDLSYLSINMEDAILGKNKYLRQAIATAIDVNKEIALLKNGRGTKLYTMVPLTIAGNENEIGKHWYDYDIDRSKQLMIQAGYPEGKGLSPIEVSMPGSTVIQRDSFEFLRESLSKVGITVVPHYRTWPSFLKSVEQAQYQMAASSWMADYPDSENFYQLLYTSENIQNNVRFNHEEFNKIYESIRFMEPGEARNEKITLLAMIVKEEAPMILNSMSLITGLTQKWVKNFKRNVLEARPFKYFDIDQDLKDKTIM